MTDTPPTDQPAPEPAPEPPAALAEPDPADALAQLAAGAVLDAMPARDELAGLAAMAVTLSAAAAIPEALRNRPNDVFLVLLTGRELGMAPTAALRGLYVVNGQVTLPPKVRKGIVTKRGLGRVWPDQANDAESATWYATRADEGHQVTYSYTFTKADALAAPEHNKNPVGDKNNLWNKYVRMGYPKRMVSWRALGYLLDDVFSEVGTGLYSPDEVGAVVDEEGHAIIDVSSTDPLPGHKAPRRHKGSGQAEPDPADAPAPAEVVEALRRRIHALPEPAMDALHELWTAQRDGAEPMHPLAHLPQRQVKRAGAMVASMEARAKRGEWGDWAPPADPDTGEVLDTTAQQPTSAHQPAQAGPSAPAATTTPDTPVEPSTARLGPDGAVLCDRWEWCDEIAGHPGACVDALGQTQPQLPVVQ